MCITTGGHPLPHARRISPRRWQAGRQGCEPDLDPRAQAARHCRAQQLASAAQPASVTWLVRVTRWEGGIRQGRHLRMAHIVHVRVRRSLAVWDGAARDGARPPRKAGSVHPPLEVPAQYRCPISLLESLLATHLPIPGARPVPLPDQPRGDGGPRRHLRRAHVRAARDLPLAVHARHQPAHWREAAQQGTHARHRAAAAHHRIPPTSFVGRPASHHHSGFQWPPPTLSLLSVISTKRFGLNNPALT